MSGSAIISCKAFYVKGKYIQGKYVKSIPLVNRFIISFTVQDIPLPLIPSRKGRGSD
jgi:hypothetical protein